MPARASSCRHVARSIYANNLPLSPLWITDEVLDNAFDRFLCVSRAAKRYGSSVPGPMEAQRRLAKRRLTGLATTGALAAFDVGVLFGSGPPTREELNWHAPANKGHGESPHEMEPPSTIIETWTSILHRLQIQEAQRARDEKARKCLAQSEPRKVGGKRQLPFDMHLKSLQTLAEARTLAQETRERESMHPAEFSRRAYRQLLTNGVPDTVLLEYLKDPTLNLPQVHNVMEFVSDRQSRGLPISREFYTALPQLISLGMVQAPELLDILNLLPKLDLATIQRIWIGMKKCRIVPDWSRCARKLLWRLDIKQVAEGSGNLKVELYQYAFPINHLRTAEAPDLGHHLAYWVKSIHNQSSTSVEGFDRATLVHIIALIGRLKKQKHFLLAATASLLNLKPASRSHLPHWHSVISSWLSLLLDAKTSASAFPTRERDPRQLDQFFDMVSEHLMPRDLVQFFQTQPAVFSSSIIAQAWLPRLCTATWSASDMAALQRDLRLIPHTDLRSSVFTRPTDHFADIVIALARRGSDYEAPMTAIADFCHGLYGIDGVFWLVKTWRYAQVRIIPEALGGILRNLAQADPWAALALYTRARLWIGSNPELLPNLITMGASAHKIMGLLHHKDPSNSMPLHVRDQPKNNLHQTRNILLHVIADAFSRSHILRTFSHRRTTKQLRNRQVFRNVYRAYRYLVTRQSPVRPLMSRALVRAAITRPLKQYEWVNTARVKFILGIVRRVEGKEVADGLDKKIYLWRGRVHRYLTSRGAYLRSKGIDPQLERKMKEDLQRKSREGQALRRRRAVHSASGGGNNDSLSLIADSFSTSSQCDELQDRALIEVEDKALPKTDQAAFRQHPNSSAGTSLATESEQKSNNVSLSLGPTTTLQDSNVSQSSRLPLRRLPSAYSTGSPRGGFREELKILGRLDGGLVRYQLTSMQREADGPDEIGCNGSMKRSTTTSGALALYARYRRSKEGFLVKVDGYRRR